MQNAIILVLNNYLYMVQLTLKDIRSALIKVSEGELQDEITQMSNEDLLECNLMDEFDFDSMDVFELLAVLEKDQNINISDCIVFSFSDRKHTVRAILEELH